MIQGDIDLTEKLDFYHDKPKEKLLPARVPWKKSGKDDSTWKWLSTVEPSSISVINTDADLNWVQNEVDNTIWYISNDNQSLHLSTTSTTSFNTWDSFDSSINYPTITTTTTTSNNGTYLVDNNDNISITFSYNNNSSTSSRPLTFKTAIYNKEKKLNLPYKVKPKENNDETAIRRCSLCDELFISRSSYPRMTCYCKKCAEKDALRENHKNTFYKIKRNRNSMRGTLHLPINLWNARVNDILPWDNDYLTLRLEKLRSTEENNYSSYHRLRMIPWLHDLQRRIFDDYEEELRNGEKDYSEYLTNMGWLGIH